MDYYTLEFLERALKRMASEPADDNGTLIWRVLYLLRPENSHDVPTAVRHFADLLGLVERHQDYAHGLRDHLLALLGHKQIGELLMSADILPTHSFAHELSQRLRYKLLPPLPQPESLRDWLDHTLAMDDCNWISGIDTGLWRRLLTALQFDSKDPAIVDLLEGYYSTITGLSHRIAAAGLETALLKSHPELQHHASPFLALHDEIHALTRHPQDKPDIAQAEVMVAQCQDILSRIPDSPIFDQNHCTCWLWSICEMAVWSFFGQFEGVYTHHATSTMYH